MDGAFMRDELLTTKQIKELTDRSYIGTTPDFLDHRFGVIAAWYSPRASTRATSTSCSKLAEVQTEMGRRGALEQARAAR
jgi:hypothetical protein